MRGQGSREKGTRLRRWPHSDRYLLRGQNWGHLRLEGCDIGPENVTGDSSVNVEW